MQVIVDEHLARPILIARPAVLLKRIEKFGLRIRPGVDAVHLGGDVGAHDAADVVLPKDALRDGHVGHSNEAGPRRQRPPVNRVR